MDKFNPREIDNLAKAYQKIAEQLPYDGIHINHQSKVDHIKKIYGGNYKVVQSPTTTSWYVLGQNGPEWIPVTSSFPSKEGATKFMQWLNKAGEIQKQMVGTIDGSDRRINEQNELNETTGNWLHGRFGDLFDFLENQAFGSLEIKKAKKVIPALTKETEKLYKLYQKQLKGSGLSGW